MILHLIITYLASKLFFIEDSSPCIYREDHMVLVFSLADMINHIDCFTSVEPEEWPALKNLYPSHPRPQPQPSVRCSLRGTHVGTQLEMEYKDSEI